MDLTRWTDFLFIILNVAALVSGALDLLFLLCFNATRDVENYIIEESKEVLP